MFSDTCSAVYVTSFFVNQNRGISSLMLQPRDLQQQKSMTLLRITANGVMPSV